MRLASIIISAIFLGACEVRNADPATGERELREANAAYDQALLDGNAAALGRFYTADYQIIDDDAGVHGKSDQIAFMTGPLDLLAARSDAVRVTMLGAGAALVTGRFAGRYRLGGKEKDFTERYTSVWVRQDGTWKIRHEHASLVP